MFDLNVTTREAAECLRILQEAREPITAADLACRLGIDGQRETQRRRIRGIVDELRRDGVRVCASVSAGYWIAANEQEWLDYCSGKQIDAKRQIGQAARRIHMVTDHKGQGLLFVKN